MEQSIELITMPVIRQNLEQISTEVKNEINSLNIENMVVSEDTIQSLKKLRAELNKKHKEYTEQLKYVSLEYNKELDSVKLLFKTSISDVFNYADNQLRDNIFKYEQKLKDEKKNKLTIYFTELCLQHDLDFITFDNCISEILLSISDKKYIEQINFFVNKTIDDINLIKVSEYVPETMALYRNNLNVSKSITDVKNRKEAEAKELARITASRTIERQNLLKSIGMKWVEITNSYEYNEDISISKNDILTLENKEFNGKVAIIEASIKEINKGSSNVPEKIEAPKAIKDEQPKKIAIFQVTATIDKLRALGEYMRDNNIIYINIEK